MSHLVHLQRSFDNLSNFPAEIINYIAKYLDLKSYFNFIQSNKSIYFSVISEYKKKLSLFETFQEKSWTISNQELNLMESDFPTLILNHRKLKKINCFWRKEYKDYFGNLHRHYYCKKRSILHSIRNNPAYLCYKNVHICEERWYHRDVLWRSRTDGPRMILYYPDGSFEFNYVGDNMNIVGLRNHI